MTTATEKKTEDKNLPNLISKSGKIRLRKNPDDLGTRGIREVFGLVLICASQLIE